MPGMEKNEAESATRDSARAPTARGKACPIDLSTSASIRVGGRIQLQLLFFLDVRFTPIAMNCGDERLSVLNRERIDSCPIFFQNARTLETVSRVVLLRVIAIAEFECTSQHADRIVIGLFAPVRIVRDFDECRVANVEQADGSNP
jgi:hypothetical protein